jgi:hypothetical protein
VRYLLTVAANDELLGTPQAHLLARCRLFRDCCSVVCGRHVRAPCHAGWSHQMYPS